MDMRNFDEQLKKAKEVALSRSERNDMRGKLSEYMSLKPIRAESARVSRTSLFSFSVFQVRFVPAVLIAFLVLASGGGAVFAAERALPGDVLYPVKVSVNEEVRAALTFGVEAKTDWALTRVERRLSEVAQLEERGELDEESALLLATKIDEHSRSAEEFESEDKDSRVVLRARLDAILNAYASTLATKKTARAMGAQSAELGEEGAEDARADASVEGGEFSVTENSALTLSALLPEPPSIVVSEKAATRLLFTAEKQRRKIQNQDDGSNPSIKIQLDVIDTHIATSQTLLRNAEYSESFREARIALELIARVRAFLKGSHIETEPVSDLPERTVPVSDSENSDEDSSQQEGMKLPVRHEFRGGVHYLSGSLSVPTPCHELKSRIAIAQSFPEQVFIELYTESSAEACIQVIAEKEFSIEVQASEKARFSGRYNNAPVTFVFTGEVSSNASDESNKNDTEPEADETNENGDTREKELSPRSLLDDINPLR